MKDLFTTCISRLRLAPLQAVEMNGKFRIVAQLLIYSNYPTNAQSLYLRSYITLKKKKKKKGRLLHTVIPTAIVIRECVATSDELV